MTRTTTILSAPDLSITFDETTGLPSRYSRGEQSWDGGSRGISVDLVRVADQQPTSVAATVREISVDGVEAVVGFAAGSVSFTLRFSVNGASVLVSLESVAESDGYELIQVDLPELVVLDDARPGAWLAHGDRGGVHTALAEATPTRLEYGAPGDFPNFSVLPLVLLGHDAAGVAMEVVGYLGNTALAVTREGATTTTAIGSTALYRVPGSATAPSLLVEQPEAVRLDFVVGDGAHPVTWLDVARVVQSRVPGRSTDYFDDKFMYAILGQIGPSKVTEPENTFAQVEGVVERVWRLTDAASQVVFVAGWPDGGHDTAYPNIGTVNPRLGGAAGWTALQTAGRERFNATVTLDDNYDDQYDNEYTAGVFDPQYLALDVDGRVQTQEAWNGVDMSQITGFAKYLVDGGPGLARARETVEKYDIRDAMLIDAMSWWSVRHDWDPTAPASAVRNLREGKFKLLDYFASLGVHVGSEVLTYPFVGHLPFTMDGPTGSTWNGFGGTAIPLLATVYRRALIYGGEGGGNASYPDPATSLFHNNRAAKWLSHDTPDAVITGMYYLHYLPWMLLSPLEVEAFDRAGSLATISLTGGYRVVIDESSGHARVTRGEQVILDGRSLSAPLGDGRVAFYSETEARLTVTLPAGATVARAEKLGPDARHPHPFTLESGVLTVDAPAFAPVIVTLGEA